MVRLAPLILALSLLGPAPASLIAAAPAAGGPGNTTCPILSGEPIDPTISVEFEGRRVYLCCRQCRREFEADPQSFREAVAQVMPSLDEAVTHTAQDQPAVEETVEHDHADHDHAAHGGAEEPAGLTKLIAWLGKFHPPSVNFPIALLISAALAELLLMLTGKPFFEASARFCVWIGSLGAVGATVLGWFFAGFKWSDATWLLTTHRWLGTAAGAWAVVVLALCIAAYRPGDAGPKWRARYRLTLFVGAAAVAVNGFFGGAMIYGLDHYAW